MSGDASIPTATGDGWCGWSTPITGDGWPISGQTVTGDGWCPIQTGVKVHKKRGRRPRPSYLEVPQAPPPTSPFVPELSYNPPLGQSTHGPRDISAALAAADREREIAVAKEKRRRQNQRALELLLMDD